jgi:cardiolipin synthase A/B
VEIFVDGQAAFASMWGAVEDAREEILLEAYILKDDGTGLRLADLLASAAARGVKVRVLTDAFGSSGTPAAFWDRMRSHGVEVRLFHPLLPYLWYQPYRDHRKILVVDRKIAFTGGMNIGDEYGSWKSHRPGRGWRDTHARIEGPAAWEMTVVFREGWDRMGGSPIEIPPLPVPPGATGPTGDGDVSALVLDSSPGRGHQETASAIAAILGAVRKRFWLTNVYFAPRRVATELLGAAARRGVDVRLLLPGLSDVPVVRHAGHGFFRDLHACGIRIFEYQPAVLHAKSIVGDGYVSIVGSTNMDFRSFHFNSECNLVLFGEGPARTLEETFETDLRQSVEITEPAWSARPLAHRFGDACARKLSPAL